MPGRYLDEATLKTYCRDEIVADTAVWTDAILAAEEFLDDQCKRRFEVATDPVTRVYRARTPCSPILWLDDFQTVTSITENATLLVVDTDYVLEPLNQRNEAGHTVPYDRAARYGTHWYYDGPKATITVIGIPDWAAIPKMVVEAGKVAAKAYMQYRDILHGLAVFESSGIAATERQARAVWDCVNAYHSHRSWGVA